MFERPGQSKKPAWGGLLTAPLRRCYALYSAGCALTTLL